MKNIGFKITILGLAVVATNFYLFVGSSFASEYVDSRSCEEKCVDDRDEAQVACSERSRGDADRAARCFKRVKENYNACIAKCNECISAYTDCSSEYGGTSSSLY